MSSLVLSLVLFTLPTFTNMLLLPEYLSGRVNLIHDVIITGARFDKAVSLFARLIVQHALDLHKYVWVLTPFPD